MDDDKTVAELRLPPAVDLTSVKLIAEEIAAKRGSPLEIDAGDVMRLGGLGVQLLLSAQRSWEDDGIPVKITKWSDVFQRDIEQLGAPIELTSQG